MSKIQFTFIDTSDALAKACQLFQDAEFVTLDTEFMREDTYWPKLCLVQIGSAKGNFVIDALAPDIDLSPLFLLLQSHAITKVLHAARQDMELLYQVGQIVPQPIFDTQVAAGVCGFGDQVGYADLVHRICNVKISKKHQFTNWAKRPLTQSQLQYAAGDVAYLVDVYLTLRAELISLDRTRWIEDELAALVNPQTYDTSPESASRQWKPRTKDPVVHHVGRNLAMWREATAQKMNIPKGWLFKDDTLTQIAMDQPSRYEMLKQTRGLSKRILKSPEMLHAILNVVDEAKASDVTALQPSDNRTNLVRSDTHILSMLKVLLQLVANREKVAARMIATSEDLRQLCANPNQDSPLRRTWRWQIFGSLATRLIQGEVGLIVRNGACEIAEVGGQHTIHITASGKINAARY